MTHSDWIDRLVLALRHRGVEGQRVGELVVDIEAYLQDSGTTPEVEFGDPAELADQLVGRSGPDRTTQVRLGIFVVASCIAWLSIFELLASGDDGLVEVTLSIFVGASVFMAGSTASFVWVMRSGGRVLEGREKPRPRLQIGAFWFTLIAAVIAVVVLPPTELFIVSETGLWIMAAISASYVIAESILQARRARLSVPLAASLHGRDLAQRWSGMGKWRTAWRLGKSAYRDADRTTE